MKPQAIATTVLTATDLSDVEQKKASALASVGRWRQLLDRLGPSAHSQAVATTVLAASSLSDVERKKAAALASMGRWKQLLKRLGPSAYFRFVDPLPDGLMRSTAFTALGPAYRMAAHSVWNEGGRKEIPDDMEAELYIGPTGHHGEPGAFVCAWLLVELGESCADEQEDSFGEPGIPLIRAASRQHRDDLGEDSWRVLIYDGAEMKPPYVLGHVWVSEEQLREWARRNS